jgi:hypothetical protein
MKQLQLGEVPETISVALIGVQRLFGVEVSIDVNLRVIECFGAPYLWHYCSVARSNYSQAADYK